MKKKILIGSIIAVVLLTLVSFSSVVGYSSVKNNPENTIITDEWDFEYCKDYLFETIVEIANNPEAKELINSNNPNLFSTNSDFRYNPMVPLRRNDNRLSVESLEILYNNGLTLIDKLDEDKGSEILSSMEFENSEFYEQLYTIIMSDDELSERVNSLIEMNEKSELVDFGPPIFCGILGVMNIVVFLILELIVNIGHLFPYWGFIYTFFALFVYLPIMILWSPFEFLYILLCVGFPI